MVWFAPPLKCLSARDLPEHGVSESPAKVLGHEALIDGSSFSAMDQPSRGWEGVVVRGCSFQDEVFMDCEAR